MSEDDKKPPREVAVEIEVEPSPAAAGAGQPAAEPAAGSNPIAELTAQVEKLEKEKKQTYDRLLRTAADFENYKKRASRDAGQAEEHGRVKLLKELLPIMDNLERALAHADAQSAEAVLEGIR